eukprot:747865-Hanusia_phi.AAC.2
MAANLAAAAAALRAAARGGAGARGVGIATGARAGAGAGGGGGGGGGGGMRGGALGIMLPRRHATWWRGEAWRGHKMLSGSRSCRHAGLGYRLMSQGNGMEALQSQLHQSGYCLLKGVLGSLAARQEAKYLIERKDSAFAFSRIVNMWNENPARFTKEQDQKILKHQGMMREGRTFDHLLLNKEGSIVRLFESEKTLSLVNNLYKKNPEDKAVYRAKDELGRCTGLLLDKHNVLPWHFTKSSLTALLFLQTPAQPDLVQVIGQAQERISMQDQKFLDTLADTIELLELENSISNLDIPVTWSQLLLDVDPECGMDVENVQSEVKSLDVKEGDMLLMKASSALIKGTGVRAMAIGSEGRQRDGARSRHRSKGRGVPSGGRGEQSKSVAVQRVGGHSEDYGQVEGERGIRRAGGGSDRLHQTAAAGYVQEVEEERGRRGAGSSVDVAREEEDGSDFILFWRVSLSSSCALSVRTHLSSSEPVSI